MTNTIFSLGFALLVFISLLILGLYYFADYLTNEGINEAVLYHLTMDMGGAGLSEFLDVIIYATLYLIFISVFSIAAYKTTLNKHKAHRISGRVVSAVAMIAAAFYVNPGVADISRLYRAAPPMHPTMEHPEQYINIDLNTLAMDQKNILYIYLESVERTYLDENLFPGLAPNLQKLEKESVSFANVTQTYGSGWTIAGMVNSQCGIPLITPSHENSMSGSDRFLPKAVCLGDILESQNYQLHYMGGASLDFAGKGNFYRSHGFRVVEGLDELIGQIPDPSYRSSWGLYDDSLFDLVKKRYDDLSSNAEPFGLFALTLDTHHPVGHTPKSCENIQYEDGSNQILNAVHCTDLLIGDLVQHIQSSPGFENTLLVIASDHLAMRNTAWDQLQQGDRKNLFLVLGKHLKSKTIDTPSAMIDMPSTLLGLLNVNIEGLGFGRNVLSHPTLIMENSDLDTFLSNHRSFISNLWSFPQINHGLLADIKNNQILLGERSIQLPAILTLNEKLEVEEVRFEANSPHTLVDQVMGFDRDQHFIWADRCQKLAALSTTPKSVKHNNYCAAMGAIESDVIKVVDITSNPKLSYKKIKTSFKALSLDSDLIEPRISNLKTYGKYGVVALQTMTPNEFLAGDYIITSAGGHQINSIIENRMNGSIVTAQRGLTLFGLAADSPAVSIKHLDTCSAAVAELTEGNYSFQEDIHRLASRFEAFVIVAHDSAICDPRDLTSLFQSTGLVEWEKIDFRTPYIGLISGNGEIKELTGPNGSRIALEATGSRRPQQVVSSYPN